MSPSGTSGGSRCGGQLPDEMKAAGENVFYHFHWKVYFQTYFSLSRCLSPQMFTHTKVSSLDLIFLFVRLMKSWLDVDQQNGPEESTSLILCTAGSCKQCVLKFTRK